MGKFYQDIVFFFWLYNMSLIFISEQAAEVTTAAAMIWTTSVKLESVVLRRWPKSWRRCSGKIATLVCYLCYVHTFDTDLKGNTAGLTIEVHILYL